MTTEAVGISAETAGWVLREITPADAGVCGRIIYEAFAGIGQRHHFPPDFPSVEAGIDLARLFTSHPAIWGVVAECAGQVVGSNFLLEHDAIRGVGPITIDPACQGRGIGRRLMEAVIDRGRGALGIRLVQDAFNTASMSLYASLGFEAREPLALVCGTPATRPANQEAVRPMREEDLPACADLCRQIHGIERTQELRDALGVFAPLVLERQGRITAYASAPTFWPLNHGVAASEQDMHDLLIGAGALNPQPLSFCMPIRQAGCFRWLLKEGLRVIKPMTLMTMGWYQQPQEGCWFPSVLY